MGTPQYRLNAKRQTFRLRRLHLLGPDACIIWARMPASTLHKSAQQEAPDANISMCKSTTQDTRAQKMPASIASGARPRRCPRLPPLARVQEDARVYLLSRASKKMPASTSSDV